MTVAVVAGNAGLRHKGVGAVHIGGAQAAAGAQYRIGLRQAGCAGAGDDCRIVRSQHAHSDDLRRAIGCRNRDAVGVGRAAHKLVVGGVRGIAPGTRSIDAELAIAVATGSPGLRDKCAGAVDVINRQYARGRDWRIGLNQRRARVSADDRSVVDAIGIVFNKETRRILRRDAGVGSEQGGGVEARGATFCMPCDHVVTCRRLGISAKDTHQITVRCQITPAIERDGAPFRVACNHIMTCCRLGISTKGTHQITVRCQITPAIERDGAPFDVPRRNVVLRRGNQIRSKRCHQVSVGRQIAPGIERDAPSFGVPRRNVVLRRSNQIRSKRCHQVHVGRQITPGIERSGAPFSVPRRNVVLRRSSQIRSKRSHQVGVGRQIAQSIERGGAPFCAPRRYIVLRRRHQIRSKRSHQIGVGGQIAPRIERNRKPLRLADRFIVQGGGYWIKTQLIDQVRVGSQILPGFKRGKHLFAPNRRCTRRRVPVAHWTYKDNAM